MPSVKLHTVSEQYPISNTEKEICQQAPDPVVVNTLHIVNTSTAVHTL